MLCPQYASLHPLGHRMFTCVWKREMLCAACPYITDLLAETDKVIGVCGKSEMETSTLSQLNTNCQLVSGLYWQAERAAVHQSTNECSAFREYSNMCFYSIWILGTGHHLCVRMSLPGYLSFLSLTIHSVLWPMACLFSVCLCVSLLSHLFAFLSILPSLITLAVDNCLDGEMDEACKVSQ